MADQGSLDDYSDHDDGLEGIEFCLNAIGFNSQQQRARLMEDGLETFEDLRNLTETDITDMAEAFGKRTVADGRIIFGTGKTRKLKGLMHWAQDYFRCNRYPDHQEFDRQTLDVAIERAQARRLEAKQSETITKATIPDKFTKEKEWPSFDRAFEGYLASIPGAHGIPLSYVIRKEATPDPDIVYANFNQETIARAPLRGTRYQTDNKQVHRLLHGLIRGGPAEEWLRDTAKREDGRKDMLKLRKHFAGEGNASRRIAEAEKLRDTLGYKHERTMPFATFLDKLQKMFNIYREEDQAMTEDAKIRELLRMCGQAQHLTLAVSSLELRHDVEPLTFQQAANHLQGVASRSHIRGQTNVRQVNQATRDTGRGRGRGRGRGGRGGRTSNNVQTDYMSPKEWEKLSYEQRDKIREERTKRGLRGGVRQGNTNGGSKRSVQQVTFADEAEDDDDDGGDDPQSAGDSFGGKREAKRKRTRKQKAVTTKRIPRTTVTVAANQSDREANTAKKGASRVELDSHADTCVLGPGFVKLSDTGQRCAVQPYLSTYEEVNDVAIVCAATSVQDQATGETVILVINQGLWFGDNEDMDHSLLNPNQLRANGVRVQDNPYSEEPTAILTGEVAIPILAEGTTLYFDCVLPTEEELQTCRHIELTSNAEWEPKEVVFPNRNNNNSYNLQEVNAYTTRTEDELFRKVEEILTDRPSPHTFVSGDRHPSVTPSNLSERWQIGVKQAQQTLRQTTQKGIRSAIMPLARRYRSDRMFHQRNLRDRFYTDTWIAKVRSAEGNDYSQIFANESRFTAVYPMAKKSNAGEALGEFINEYGIMQEIIMDGSKEQTGKNTEFMKRVKKYDIKWRVTEHERHNQNRAEGAIRELKRKWYRIMVRKKVPQRLWDYGLRWASDINNRTVNSSTKAHGRTPLELLTGETPDISEYLDFGFYDYVWVQENAGLGEQIMCRWLGVAHRIGSQMCYYVIKSNGQIIARTTVQRVTNLELQTTEVQERCEELDAGIKRRHKDEESAARQAGNRQRPKQWNQDAAFDDEFQALAEEANVIDDPGITHAETRAKEANNDAGYEPYLNMELAIATGPEETRYGKVTKRVRDNEGKPLGVAHDNPMLDSRRYQVTLLDGTTLEMTANNIAQKKRLVSKVKSKYWLTTHKFGIRVPKTVEEALRIDRENGNTLWRDAINKEMKNVRVAFEPFEGAESDIPTGYQKIACHMIFDIKMSENFRRKARFVAGGHRTETPSTLTYSSVVSRDSVRIALMLAALNGLGVEACDIQNAYVTADCREKIYTTAGPEFGSEQGSLTIIKKALYGLKSSGAAFRALLAETLYDHGFRPTMGDPDVHIRPAVKGNGFKYYEMILTYVDDIICVSHRAKETLKAVIQQSFQIKNDLIEPPDMYLGAQLAEREIAGTQCWTMTSNKYVSAAVERVEEALKRKRGKLPKGCLTPMRSGYRPEIDETDELDAEGLRTYQEYIGILRWAVELGRIDIMVEVSMLSTHLANPRVGHLEQALHVFGYLKRVPKKTLAFDPSHPDVKESRFVKHNWEDFYREAEEQIPNGMPEPRGEFVSLHCFVDASHADNKANRRSQTGILIFVNRAPVMWFSKRQNTVETSTFGSEMTAMRIATEMIQALRIKLRSFGVPLEGACNVYCDNESATKAARLPESTLAKKHNAVAYHKVRESVAMGMIRVTWEPTATNLADLLTKTKTARDREKLIDRFMY